jgi:hypothetical protein
MITLIHARNEMHYDQIRALWSEYSDISGALAEQIGACA